MANIHQVKVLPEIASQIKMVDIHNKGQHKLLPRPRLKLKHCPLKDCCGKMINGRQVQHFFASSVTEEMILAVHKK